MDDLVLQSMAKWPHVPACAGWLGLDGRGDWYLRDEAAQARGAFASGAAGAKGSRVQHERLIDFIGRNYGADERGRWFFQNGPQRVFVELESTPWIWRVTDGGAGAPTVRTHTGVPAPVLGTWIDEAGLLYLHSDRGLGRVHPQDMLAAANAIEHGHWPEPVALRAAELPGRFGYCPSPQAAAE